MIIDIITNYNRVPLKRGTVQHDISYSTALTKPLK